MSLTGGANQAARLWLVGDSEVCVVSLLPGE